MSEALAQRSNLQAYWRGILMFNAASHPWTCDLLAVAACVGQFQGMHYKNEFNRPRPSQILPALMPPISPPGHASFPSAHATEAYLMALCLKEVMPAAVSTPVDPNDPETTALQRMAQRIARNREVLGVHYPSDSAAGKKLAEESFRLLKKCRSVHNTNPNKPGIIQRAQAEWA
jgi:membrane-associated phospholipid phosphatase